MPALPASLSAPMRWTGGDGGADVFGAPPLFIMSSDILSTHKKQVQNSISLKMIIFQTLWNTHTKYIGCLSTNIGPARCTRKAKDKRTGTDAPDDWPVSKKARKPQVPSALIGDRFRLSYFFKEEKKKGPDGRAKRAWTCRLMADSFGFNLHSKAQVVGVGFFCWEAWPLLRLQPWPQNSTKKKK